MRIGIVAPVLLASASFIACKDSVVEPADRREAIEGTTTGGLPRIVHRNAIMSTDFRPIVMTPDGLLGLSLEAGQQPGLIALDRVRGTVVDGRPAVASPDAARAATVVPVAYDSLFDNPPVNLSNPFLPDLPANSTGQTWTILGQGMLSLDARFSPSTKPFRVDSPEACLAATPATVAAVSSPLGRFDCYRLIHIAPRLHATINAPVAYRHYLRWSSTRTFRTPRGELGAARRRVS